MSAKIGYDNTLTVAVRMLVYAAVGLLASLAVPAANQERGRALYENQCQSCHAEWIHGRVNRKAKSLTDLRRRADAWSTHGGLDWSSEEIDDVVDYLNAHFYHFK